MDAHAYDHIGHARFYEEVRAALALERITVFGHSFGGTVGLNYAALYPSESARCICMDGLVASPELEGSDAAAAEAEMLTASARHQEAVPHCGHNPELEAPDELQRALRE